MMMNQYLLTMLTEVTGFVAPLQSSGGGIGGVVTRYGILILVLLTLAGGWKTFQKAGEPGVAIVIPIYNFYVMLRIGNNNWWFLPLLCIPFIGLYYFIKRWLAFRKHSVTVPDSH